ncbi:hypothetical protein DBV39_19190 [Orrella marina]|uniref:Uncharacterized protein n=2 Tax=Orrella marina TaxID=2163011 RepID=A0A2R4XP26_9BURK|nr:hypothetical protein DBV39_19190 [Orrella marina]
MPEPVTADEIRFGMRRIDADQQYIEVEQAEAYAQAVRDEAEKLSRAKHYGNGYQDGWNSALEQAAKAAESIHHDSAPYWVALRIRELKMEQP